MDDVSAVAGAALPYLSAVAGAYGAAVLQRVADLSGDVTADAAVGLGRRLLRRLSGSAQSAEIEEAVTQLAVTPHGDAQADLLRAAVRRALADDPDLEAEITDMLVDAGAWHGGFRVSVSGGQGVQLGQHNTQFNTFNQPMR